ncbi:hypothetical protein [Aeromonas jandaei]|uniref:hypothetical protein n=1 Tax=Aeromonas jandaei TaxID=650 RepID=UPI003BA0E2BA
MNDLLKNKCFLVAGSGGPPEPQLTPPVLAQGGKVIAADIKVDAMAQRVWRWYSPDSCPQKGMVIRLQTE